MSCRRLRLPPAADSVLFPLLQLKCNQRCDTPGICSFCGYYSICCRRRHLPMRDWSLASDRDVLCSAKSGGTTAGVVSLRRQSLSQRRQTPALHGGAMGLLRSPTHVTNEVKGLLTLVESSSRRFFAALRMTRGGFFNSPAMIVSVEEHAVSLGRQARGGTATCPWFPGTQCSAALLFPQDSLHLAYFLLLLAGCLLRFTLALQLAIHGESSRDLTGDLCQRGRPESSV